MIEIANSIYKGYKWLESAVQYDEKKQEKDNAKKRKFKLRYLPQDILPIYVLNFFDNPIVNKFKKSTEDKKFWLEIENSGIMPAERDFHLIYFFHELGLSSNKYFKEYIDDWKKDITNDGRFWNFEDHVSFLRLLIALEPESNYTKKMLEFALEEIQSLLHPSKIRKYSHLPEVCIFILALSEYDFLEYRDFIEKAVDLVIQVQNADGSWGNEWYEIYPFTYFSLKTICRFRDHSCEAVTKGIDFILKNQHKDGHWNNNLEDTSYALLSLLLSSPQIMMSHEKILFKDILHKQETNRSKPHFLHTSPIYNKQMHVKEIYNKVKGMLHGAERIIRIISPYIDMFYEDIINLAKDNPNIQIKIITRPKKDIKGLRERIAKNVLDLLQIATKGNIRISELIHSRLIIVDDREVLVSSADLTRDSLYDEFNAGIYTKDKETVIKSIEYFENIWKELSEEKEAI